MNSNEVRDFVNAQLGDERKNKFGWDFSDCLIDPPQLITIKSNNEFTYESWLIFDDDETGNRKGYLICFNEDNQSFDLVTGKEGISVSTCFNFLEAINGL